MSGFNMTYVDNSPDFLVRKQTEVVAQCEAILHCAEKEDRELSDDESMELTRLDASFQSLKSQIEVAGKINAMQNACPGRGRRTNPDEMSIGGNFNYGVKSWAHGGATNLNGFTRKTFGNVSPEMHGFKDARDYFSAVFNAMAGIHDPRLFQNAGGSSVGEGTSGGLFVPSPVFASILDDVINASVVLPRCRTVPINSMTASYPRWENLDRSVGLVAGFDARLIGEGNTSTIQKGKVTTLNVHCNKIGIFTTATNELVQDAPAFVSSFQGELVKAAAYKLDKLIIAGTGVGQPLGIRNSNSFKTVTAEAGQTADTIVFANVAKMFGSLCPAEMNRSVWLVHNTCVPMLIQMSNPIRNQANTDTVGGTSALTQGPDGSFTLLGRPVIVTEHMAQLGDLGDIALVDLSQYAFFLRNQGSVETNQSDKWLSDEMSFRLIVRMTGCPIWDDVGKLPNSGGTESWCVMLDAR